MIFLVIAIIVFVIIFFLRKRKDTGSSYFNKQFSSQNDTYSVRGEKRHFKITKNDDVTFEVVNGEIVSVTNQKGQKYNY